MYHGATDCKHNDNGWAPNAGACFTDDLSAAMAYAGSNGTIYIVEIDTDEAVEVDGYDHDTDDAPGDADLSTLPGDVITYDDEDEYGREHTCWRLVTDSAASAATVARAITVEELEENDIEDSFELDNYLAK